MSRIERVLMGLCWIVDGLAYVLTLGAWNPGMAVKLTEWILERQ